MDTLAASVYEANHDGTPTKNSSLGGTRSGNTTTRAKSGGKRIGRKSSLSFRRIPGVDPDTGELIAAKNPKNAAVATMFIHRARKAAARKPKDGAVLRRAKLKLKNKNTSIESKKTASTKNVEDSHDVISSGDLLLPQRTALAPLRKLTPRQKELGKRELSEIELRAVARPTATPTTTTVVGGGQTTGVKISEEKDDGWDSSRPSSVCGVGAGGSSGISAGSSSRSSSNEESADDGTDAAAHIGSARSHKSIFAELFAKLQKDLRHLKSNSRQAADYSKNVEAHLNKCKGKGETKKQRGSFLQRLSSLSRRRSSKLSSGAISG